MSAQCDWAIAGDAVILGGGLAGLTAAFYSGAPVYEAAEHPGGAAWSDPVGGIAFDRGIHVLQTSNQSILELLAELGVELSTIRRQAYIYARGTYTAYPFQVNTTGLPLALRLRCVYDFLRRTGDAANPKNYTEWIEANLGRGFAETFMLPYSQKFWTIDLEQMTYEWTGGRVPQPSAWQVLRGAFVDRRTAIGSNAVFQYPSARTGYATIAQALVRRVRWLHLDHRAVRIDVRRHRVHFANGRDADYRVLISAIPLPELVAILSEVPAEVRAATALLRANSVLSVGLAIDGPSVEGRHWVHFPEPEFVFFRISYPHNFTDPPSASGPRGICAEIAHSATRPLPKEGLIERVEADLRRAGAMLPEDRIIATGAYDIKYAYCIYDHNRRAAIRTIRDWLHSIDIVPSGRYGLWTYFWSHEAMLSGRKSAKLVRQMLAAGRCDAVAAGK